MVVWLSFNALKGYLALFFPKGLFGKIMGYENSGPVLTLYDVQFLGLIFG